MINNDLPTQCLRAHAQARRNRESRRTRSDQGRWVALQNHVPFDNPVCYIHIFLPNDQQQPLVANGIII
jgi:hypothetical protein